MRSSQQAFLVAVRMSFTTILQRIIRASRGSISTVRSRRRSSSLVVPSQDANGPRVSLVKPATSTVTVNFSVGSQAQLDAYNAKNGTSYKLLPSTMYELPASVTIPAGQTSASIPCQAEGSYLLKWRSLRSAHPAAGEQSSRYRRSK